MDMSVLVMFFFTGATYFLIRHDYYIVFSWWSTALIYQMLIHCYQPCCEYDRLCLIREVPVPIKTDCIICLDEIDTGVGSQLTCSCIQVYHTECLTKWLHIRPYCPICRH